MTNNQNGAMIAKYIRINLKILIKLSVFTTLPLIYTCYMVAGYTITDTLVALTKFFFKILSLVATVLIAILVIDATDIEKSCGMNGDYTLLKMLYNNETKAEIEICLGIAGVYLFMLVGMMRQWLYEEFGEKAYLPDGFIYLFLLLGSIAIITRVCLWLQRNNGKNLRK